MQKCKDTFGTYETVKVVRLKDGRLACFRLLTLLGCLAYVLFQLFHSHQYAKFITPVGEVAVEYVAPTGDFTVDHDYCNNSEVPRNNTSVYPPGCVFDCKIWDELQFSKTDAPSTTFITTHVNASYQSKADCNEPCPVPWLTTGQEDFYVSQVEDYSLKLTTTFQASQNGGTADYANMTYYLKGKLVDPDGNTLQTMGNSASDKFNISTLLKAGGLNSINDVSDWTYNKDFNYTYRTWGMLLIVTIDLDNRDGALLGDPTYTYTVKRVPNKKYLFRGISPDPVFDSPTRTVYNRYGIQVIFSVVGDIGFFDWQTTLLTLVGASALLGVSTVVVEFFMLRILRNKERYKDVKYDVVSIQGSASDLSQEGYSAIATSHQY